MLVRGLVSVGIVIALAPAVGAAIATFDHLTLEAESFWNGSDESGGFYSGCVFFANNYNPEWQSWDGFSYSNRTDTALRGLDGQYSAMPGAGQGGSTNYAVCYVGWSEPPIVVLDQEVVIAGLYVTNTAYAYYSMLEGDMFAKKFGGPSGDDEDWFKLTVTGKDSQDQVTATAEFYLADFRFADNTQDYIADTWEYVDLTSLGRIKSLEFALTSSDVDPVYGMKTPALFAVDTIAPEVGPYTEVGVNGYIDPATRRHANPLADAAAVLNPIFRGWATSVAGYDPAPGVSGQWSDPAMALGPATGSHADVVSLGDLQADQLADGALPGTITMMFGESDTPGAQGVIRNGRGYDFAVFENGLISQVDLPDLGSMRGEIFADFGYVEVSSNGTDFVRFPSVCLQPSAVARFGTVQVSNYYGLAGKHPNGYGTCTGTPFDLDELADDPKVVSGAVDLNDIRYVRIVDVPGSGDFFDEAVRHTDPGTWPDWAAYTTNHAVYDPWVTVGSGGFDLEAIGVLHEQQYPADISLDGVVDWTDLALLASAWGSRFGQSEWIGRCDLAGPRDLQINAADLVEFSSQWLCVETWRTEYGQ